MCEEVVVASASTISSFTTGIIQPTLENGKRVANSLSYLNEDELPLEAHSQTSRPPERQKGRQQVNGQADRR
jgi:hypothetical protein